MKPAGVLKFWKRLRDEAKWWTIGSSLTYALTDLLVETRYISYSSSPMNTSPPLVTAVFNLSCWLTLFFAVLTFPRWYSFIAIASVIWVAFCILGR